MTTTTTDTITVNHNERLYVIHCKGGYSCHGFDVVERLISRLTAEGLTPPLIAAEIGTPERYEQYRTLCAEGREKSAGGKWKSTAELTPELIGKEGRHVEVTHQWKDGEKETVRFQVGRSTGWMPCHLQLARRDDTGGFAVCLGKILSVRVIN